MLHFSRALLVAAAVSGVLLGTAPAAHADPSSSPAAIATAAQPMATTAAEDLCVRVGDTAGFTRSALVTAVAVALAESNCNPAARNVNGDGSVDRGLWQINDRFHPDVSDACAFDAQCNANAAFRISSGGTTWTPWSTFNSGAYKSFLSEAQAAVNRLSPSPPPVVRVAPALAYDNGATMNVYRWASSGSAFSNPPDVYSSGSYNLDKVGRLTADGDVNGDGKTDLVQAYRNTDGTFSFEVFLDGANWVGVWYTSGSFNLANVGGRLVVADFNGDGKAEPALVYDNGTTQSIYRWLSTGSSFTRTTDYVGTGTFDLANVQDRVGAGDVNGDGKADIVEAYQTGSTFNYYVFLNGLTSDGVWYTSGTFNLANVANRMVVGDFNGDGKAEPAMVYDSGTTQTIYRWVSTGSSFTHTTDYVGTGTFDLVNVQDRVSAGDVNGDGKDDIVEAYQTGTTFNYYVFLNGLTSDGVWYTSGTFNLANVHDRLNLGNW